jgi:hypothetical protein
MRYNCAVSYIHVDNSFWCNGVPVNIYDNNTNSGTVLATGINNQKVYPGGPTAGSQTTPFQWVGSVIPTGTNLCIEIIGTGTGSDVAADAGYVQPDTDDIVCGAVATGNWSNSATWLPHVPCVPQAISNAISGTAGVVRITVPSTAGWKTGNTINVLGVLGTTEANGVFTVTVVDGTHAELGGTTFVHTYTSGGTAFRGDSVGISSGVALTLDTGACDAGGLIIVGKDPGTGGVAAIKAIGALASQPSFTMNSGTILRIRGDIIQDSFSLSESTNLAHHCDFTMNAGSSLVFDPPSGGQYVYSLDHISYFFCNGSSGSHCVVETDKSRGGTAMVMSGFNSVTASGLMVATYTDFFDMGTSSSYGLRTKIADEIGFDVAITNCTLTRCNIRIEDSGSNHNFTLSHNAASSSIDTTDPSANTSCAYISLNSTPGTGVKTFTYNSFDKIVDAMNWNSVITHHNSFAGPMTMAGVMLTPDDTYFHSNLFAFPAASGVNLALPTHTKNCYMFGVDSNQHYANVIQNGSVVDGCIFENTSGNPTGDLIFNGATNDLKIINCFSLFQPDPTAGGPGVGLSNLGGGTGPYTIEHNLYCGYSDGGIAARFGEAGADSTVNALASCQSNIMFLSVVTADSQGLVSETPADTVVDIVLLSDYNGMHNPSIGVIHCNGVDQNAPGYLGLRFSAAGFPQTRIGTHDFIADPQFFDPRFRNLELWGFDLHGTDGSAAQALAVLAADPSLISGMITWVKAGYAPTNIVYEASSYPGDTSTVDSNGNPWPGGAPGVGPMAFVAASTYTPWIFGDQIESNSMG